MRAKVPDICAFDVLELRVDRKILSAGCMYVTVFCSVSTLYPNNSDPWTGSNKIGAV